MLRQRKEGREEKWGLQPRKQVPGPCLLVDDREKSDLCTVLCPRNNDDLTKTSKQMLIGGQES